MSLLEHVARPCQVVNPWPCLLRPRLIPVEPLSEGPERQSRCFPHQRLMCRFMDYETVDSIERFLIGGRLQGCWRPTPRRGRCSQRFGCRDVLSVDVRYRSRFSIVRVVAVLHVVDAGPLRPHRAHRHFVKLLHFHPIGDECASGFM